MCVCGLKCKYRYGNMANAMVQISDGFVYSLYTQYIQRISHNWDKVPNSEHALPTYLSLQYYL